MHEGEVFLQSFPVDGLNYLSQKRVGIKSRWSNLLNDAPWSDKSKGDCGHSKTADEEFCRYVLKGRPGRVRCLGLCASHGAKRLQQARGSQKVPCSWLP